ncbi:MAG: protein-L-isoaspartate(D-aspartate) O-methyltransferase [Bacteriovoracaceae bacterium]|jgi:protein-L-isoaspartate(D-aspartate) O-methyltransferase|nr:protein-L-isoaspartate(D-aspartate) O-methyltransferase [Bacteriovoracaceae bacterium]
MRTSQQLRNEMVKRQIENRGVRDGRVLQTFRNMPRDEFVPEDAKAWAYDDCPIPIGYNQTISQPYIVAFMAEALELSSDERILEIGTGSGYNAAVLSKLCREVYTIEIIPELAKRAEEAIEKQDIKNAFVRQGDGSLGWPEEAPFDAIILTAAPPKEIPIPLVIQLKQGGRLIAPVGEETQELALYIKQGISLVPYHLMPVRFVPMIGKIAKQATL